MSGAVTVTVAVVAVATAVESAVTVGLTVATVLAATAAVGATLAAVGTFTNDSTLKTIGTVVGAVGAVGALANSAGLLGELGNASLFGSGTEAAASTVDEAGFAATDWNAAAAAQPGANVSGLATEATPSFMDSASAAVGSPAADTATAASASPVTGTSGFASADQAANLVPNAAGQGGDAVPTGADLFNSVPATTGDAAVTTPPPAAEPAPTTGQPAGTAPTPPAAQTTAAPASVAPPAPSAADAGIPGSANAATAAAGNVRIVVPGATAAADQSALGGLLEFMKGNPLVAYGAIQAGSSFFAGAFGGDKSPTQEQLDAWRAQANANSAAANYQNQKTANIASGMPVSNKPLPGTGLINTATAQLKPAGLAVTGVPA